MHTISEVDEQTLRRESNESYLRSFKLWIHSTAPTVLQQLTTTAWHSYGFLFFRCVVNLTSSGFGWLYFISQLSKVVTIALMKCYAQKHDTTNTCGTWFCLKDKITIHLFGSVGVLFFWPFLLAPCVGCMVNPSIPIITLAYFFPFVFYSCFLTILGMTGFFINELSPVQKSHARQLEDVLQSSTQKSSIGLVLHIVTWVFLAHSKGKNISKETQSAFGNQTLFIVVVGFVSTILYNLTAYDFQRKRKSRRKRQEQPVEEEIATSSTPKRSSLAKVQEVKKVYKLHFGPPWKLRCQELNYLVSVFVHVLSTNIFNIVLLLLPVYLIEAMKANKLSVANFPTVVFGGFSIGSLTAKKLIITYGYKGLYCTCAGFTLAAGIWFLSQSVRLSDLLYFPALAFGFCCCIMIVTSHMMLMIASEDIGVRFTDTDGFTRAMDELWNGVVVFIIMQAFPDEHHKSHVVSKQTVEFLRISLFYVPAMQVVVAVIRLLLQNQQEDQDESEKLKRIQDYVEHMELLRQPVLDQDTSDDKDPQVTIQHSDLETLKDLPASNV